MEAELAATSLAAWPGMIWTPDRECSLCPFSFLRAANASHGSALALAPGTIQRQPAPKAPVVSVTGSLPCPRRPRLKLLLVLRHLAPAESVQLVEHDPLAGSGIGHRGAKGYRSAGTRGKPSCRRTCSMTTDMACLLPAMTRPGPL